MRCVLFHWRSSSVTFVEHINADSASHMIHDEYDSLVISDARRRARFLRTRTQFFARIYRRMCRQRLKSARCFVRVANVWNHPSTQREENLQSNSMMRDVSAVVSCDVLIPTTVLLLSI